MRRYICVYIYIHVYVCMYTYIYIYIYMCRCITPARARLRPDWKYALSGESNQYWVALALSMCLYIIL